MNRRVTHEIRKTGGAVRIDRPRLSDGINTSCIEIAGTNQIDQIFLRDGIDQLFPFGIIEAYPDHIIELQRCRNRIQGSVRSIIRCVLIIIDKGQRVKQIAVDLTVCLCRSTWICGIERKPGHD